ncbi:hypothetical protein ACK1XN_005065, partial [Salmonella enterica]
DTSGKLLSKEARAGTTTIAVGKAVKQTVDTRFYPRVHVCVSNLSAYGYIVPGQTEVQICDGSNHAVPNGSGYTVTRPGLSSAGCTKRGGGVCPPDLAGLKADFTGLTGDDIAQLVFHPTEYDITDNISNASYKSTGPGGQLAYYGVLGTELGPVKVVTGYDTEDATDAFRIERAEALCKKAPGETVPQDKVNVFSEALDAGTTTGGTATTSGGIVRLYTGSISGAIKAGTDARPALFVSGWDYHIPERIGTWNDYAAEVRIRTVPTSYGTQLPGLLVMVAGAEGKARAYNPGIDGVDFLSESGVSGDYVGAAIGRRIASVTGMSLANMYSVSDYPDGSAGGHKPDKNDTNDLYVAQVNYVTGYVCEASLQ